MAIDLFSGLGGWAEGFLAEGYDVVGFDIEPKPYPGQLVIQDVRTLDGKQFKDATVIVASPPCPDLVDPETDGVGNHECEEARSE